MQTTTIEKKVADAILQREKEVNVCGKTFMVTPATPATLIMVSELVSELPAVELGDNAVKAILKNAKDCRVVGKVAATLILGGKRIRERRKIVTRRLLFWKKEQSELEWLTERLLEECTNAELSQIISARLGDMQLGDFFGITTSLSVASLTRPTAAAETASGEWS